MSGVATDTGAQAPVLFAERDAGAGKRIGIATLNAPKTLNGLSLPMAKLLDEKLRVWAADSSIALVVLEGAGEKAFCAGGDLHSLYKSMQTQRENNNVLDEMGAGKVLDNAYAAEFFEVEYRLDHLIHTYPKPVLCWGHGIVMGGGIGLMSGASHRVVSERSKLAFPEITVGLFPDVGGSWLLNRVPDNGGRFLALTGALLNPGDALYAQLADHYIAEERRGEVLNALSAAEWSADAAENRAHLTKLLQGFATDAPAGPLQANAKLIAELCASDDVEDTATAIASLKTEDAWLQAAQKTLASGAPGSARLGFDLQLKAASLSLAETFRLEYIVALRCAAHGDFAEGIRALLIDKDRNPQWQPRTLAQANADWAESFYAAPAWPGGVHPLADLGQPGDLNS